MAKVWQFSQGHPKPASSQKVKRGEQDKFFKNRLRSSPRLKSPTALWRKLHYNLIKMHLKWKDWRRCCRKRLLRKSPNGQVSANFARLPETTFSKKVQRGDQEKFFKNHPNSSPRLKIPKKILRQMVLSSNYYTFKVQRLDKVSAQTPAPKVPEWPSYNNFRKVT